MKVLKYAPVFIVIAFVGLMIYAILDNLGVKFNFTGLKEFAVTLWPWLLLQITSTIIVYFLYIMFREFEDKSARSQWKKPYNILGFNFSVHWLNTGTSSKDKWKTIDGRLQPYQKKWYHFGVEPKYEEKFPYSSTFGVPLTDGEHTFQKQQINAIIGGIFIWSWLAGLSAFIGIYSFTFLKEKYFKHLD